MKKNFNYFIFLSLTISISIGAKIDKQNKILEIDEINFWKSMDVSSIDFQKKYSDLSNKKILDILANLWQKNNFYKIEPSDKPKIPKIIHQIWVGPKEIPLYLKRFQKTWIDNHPDWEYKLWTNESVKTIELYNEKFYYLTNDPIEKADILRYEILYKFGGVYVDADFECIKSLDLLVYYYDFFAGIAPNNAKTIINNAIIGSTQKHPILDHIIKNINFNHPKNIIRSGTIYFSNEVAKIINSSIGINIAFPISFFYSIPKNYDFKQLDKYIKPESIALHYWNNWNKLSINLDSISKN